MRILRVRYRDYDFYAALGVGERENELTCLQSIPGISGPVPLEEATRAAARHAFKDYLCRA